ncbi:MAG: cytochrome c biogenesis protein CcdA [Paracoccus sp. (in: a-proteobacteria)]|uniref:cytochrome c biogenesis CcdA family protein n=1 Tax=Paracoccus sp. TaxID=267 RepID=UPI0026E0E143|nr:cytochrome c biogenesis protein CcdA [Paracoccus sp. (in: a-proteobacteria)]MDO5632993.1 cytochrome c biogenesis protein CcdA [Paracoccus sp. (in: a-proteobacteria)]
MLGMEIVDAAFLPAAFVALLAGVLSFLSPCVLPIVPPYLGYMAGVSVSGLKTGERSAVLPALFFVMGLSTVFLLMGLAASTFGRLVLTYMDWLARISGVMVIVLGLHFLRVFRIPILDQEARMQAGKGDGGALGAYVLGLAFAFGWTPCIGPILGMILSLAASSADASRGMGLLAVYALGLGIPFLLSALFINRAIGLMNRIKPYLATIERAMGVLLIVVGVMLLTGAFASVSFWLLETFPGLALLG